MSVSAETGTGKPPLNDTQRASNYFKWKLDDLVALVEAYRQRTFVEDVLYLKDKLGGTDSLLDELKVKYDQGLNPTDFEQRDQVYGSNFKKLPERTPFCKFFLNAMDDFMLKLLIVCAIISIVVDMSFADASHRKIAWIEGTAILIAVFVVSSVGAWNDYKKEEQFLKLNALSEEDNISTVRREGGEEKVVRHNDLKVGEIIKIKAGMDIPVDGIVLHQSGLLVTEAAMTGEPDELKKDTLDACLQKLEEKKAEMKGEKDVGGHHDVPSPVLLSGTQIATGEGWFLCIVVGKHTCKGKIMDKLEQKVETTPLQMKLEAIGSDIGKLGMYAALLTVHVLFLRFFIERMPNREFKLFYTAEGADSKNLTEFIKEWLRYYIVGITIIVVAVPEGLPLAVMISLAYSVKKMLIDKNFVKRLASCEIMGGANNICSDKTGTLTMNKMTVTNIWAGRDLSLKVNEDKYDFSPDFNAKHADLITQAVCCNTSGTIEEATATEKAMLEMIEKFQQSYKQIRQQHLPEDFLRFHFTSKRKRMSTILENNTNTEYGYDKRVHMKGAAEYVLASCSHYLNQDGNKVELKDEMKENIRSVIENYASQALRTICFAYKDLQVNEGGPTHEDMSDDGFLHQVEKSGYTCISIFGIKDIIRKEVPGAVEQCQKAGIIVRMVTGDNKTTAMAIAKECQIITDQNKDTSDVVMEGPEFFETVGGLMCKTCKQDSPCSCDPKDCVEGVKNMAAFKPIWKNLRVLARSRPEDKYLMVTGLRELGDIVAVTGDGTNDAPALKKADVGFAMGITGTDVSKHAADIIVMDDNFASIVKACMWGRNIYDNIRKFLQFQLSVNIVALISAFIGACILKESPLQPIQLLWVNLIMDSLGSLALATEPPKIELLDRPPYRKDEYIISRKMVKHLLVMSIWQSIVIFGIVFGGEYFLPESVEEKEQWFKPDETKYPNKIASYCSADSIANADKEDNRATVCDFLTSDYVFPGRSKDWDDEMLYEDFKADFGPSRHFAIAFNVFVQLQIFNMVNARKINDEMNIFNGILDNSMYLIVLFLIIVFQFLIVQFTQDVFEVSRAGLTGTQWGISLALGFSTWIIDFIAKFLPDNICPEFGSKERDPMDEGNNQDNVLGLRKKRTQSFSVRQGGVQREDSGVKGSIH